MGSCTLFLYLVSKHQWVAMYCSGLRTAETLGLFLSSKSTLPPNKGCVRNIIWSQTNPRHLAEHSPASGISPSHITAGCKGSINIDKSRFFPFFFSFSFLYDFST